MQATSKLEGLPAPTGRHGVGRVSFEWVDQGRAEVYSSNPQDRRELVVWVWYPAAPDPDANVPPTCPSRGRRVASSSAWTPPGC
jgi:hypothetical protein